MSTIQVRDITVHYEDAGTGRPLLFVHGMCGEAEVWREQLDRLSGDFRCVAYDRRGHSRSTRGDEPESVETHAADAAALIEALGLAAPIVVGSSGGARIAVELARTRPELVSGAVFSEPPIMTLVPDAGQALMDTVAAAVSPADSPVAAVDAFFTALCPGLWTRLDEPRKNRFRANAPMLFADLTAPTYAFTTAEAASIAVPCLVISGTISHPALRTIAAVLAESLPHGRLVSLDGSGHGTHSERPDEFAAAVAAFATEPALLSR